jgi:hypothetical protein
MLGDIPSTVALIKDIIQQKHTTKDFDGKYL